MRRCAITFLAAVSAVALGHAAARAADDLAQLRVGTPERPAFRVESAAYGIKLTTPVLGLRVELFPLQGEAGARYESLRHEPYRNVPFSLGAPPAPGLRISEAGGKARAGWNAFGSLGPLRWAKPLEEDSDVTLRFGGRPGGPDRLNFGFQYRF